MTNLKRYTIKKLKLEDNYGTSSNNLNAVRSKLEDLVFVKLYGNRLLEFLLFLSSSTYISILPLIPSPPAPPRGLSHWRPPIWDLPWGVRVVEKKEESVEQRKFGTPQSGKKTNLQNDVPRKDTNKVCSLA